ncbi:MAG: hypothetical protein K8U57_27005 [Planctomycetes bacterium]|nr:hypothetical protein [Planctomycetota bacterium]
MASTKADGNPNSPWRQVDRAIFDKAGADGIVGILKENGLDWPDSWRTTGEWASHDRRGQNSSTSINIKNGLVYDHNGGECVGIWHYCAHHGRFTDWQAAQAYYAGKYGITLPTSTRGRTAASRPLVSLPHTPADHGKAIPQWRENIHATLQAFLTNAKAGRHHERIAREMGGVCWWALADCGVGVMPDDFVSPAEFTWKKGYSTWPEITVTDDGLLTPMSANQRPPEGSEKDKEALFNRPRGITIPKGWKEHVTRTRTLLIDEGGSDCAASGSMGLGCLGYWQAGAGASYLAAVIRRAIMQKRIPEKFVIILTRDIDRSGYANTKTAKIAQHLADRLGMPVWHRMMPHDPNWKPPVAKDTLPAAPEPQLTERQRLAMGGLYETWLIEHERARLAKLPPPFPQVHKDVRAWLKARVPDAHKYGRGDLNHIGLEFLAKLAPDITHNTADVFVPRRLNHDYLGPEHDETTEDDIRKSLASFCASLIVKPVQESVPEKCPLSSLLINTVATKRTSDGTDSCTHESVAEPVPPTLDLAPVRALRPRTDTKCPDWGQQLVRRRDDPTKLVLVDTVCHKRPCPVCGPENRFTWASLARQRLSSTLADGIELHVWRGSRIEATGSRLRSVRRLKGKYVCVEVGDTDAILVATVKFAKSEPITHVDAFTEVIAAIAVVVIAPDDPQPRPVRMATCWAMARERRPSQHERIDGWSGRKSKTVLAKLKAVGLKLEQVRDGLHVGTAPDCMTEGGAERAVIWAKFDVDAIPRDPDGYIPDVAAVLGDMELMMADNSDPYHFDSGEIILPHVPDVPPVVTPTPAPPAPTPTLFDNPTE